MEQPIVVKLKDITDKSKIKIISNPDIDFLTKSINVIIYFNNSLDGKIEFESASYIQQKNQFNSNLIEVEIPVRTFCALVIMFTKDESVDIAKINAYAI